MKRMKYALMGLMLAAVGAHAQTAGYLVFSNDFTSLVTNGLSGALVTQTNGGIRAALYVAADGVTDEAAFVAISNTVPVGIPAGRYSGGTRAVPGYAPSNAVMIQVRAFETNYGNTYEAAYAAPAMNGRRALVGKSSIARVFLGNLTPTTGMPRVGAAVGGFTVAPVDGPPAITSTDIAVSEGSNGVASATFKVRLLFPSVNVVTVDYATADVTALAGSDYVATTGTLEFQPGETIKNVTVTLLPDGAPEPVETFNLVLSNPQGASLLQSTFACTIVEVRITGLSVDTSVTFNTLAGRHYMLEKSTDGINWGPVPGVSSDLTATGTSMTVVDRGSGCQGMTLYRANLLP
jgi:hypothetical protein